jgi:hypothetical protein
MKKYSLTNDEDRKMAIEELKLKDDFLVLEWLDRYYIVYKELNFEEPEFDSVEEFIKYKPLEDIALNSGFDTMELACDTFVKYINAKPVYHKMNLVEKK